MNWKAIATVIVLMGLSMYAVFDFNSEKEEIVLPESGQESEPSSDSGNQEVIQPVTGTPVGITPGDQAPDFELEMLNGETAKLSDFKGKRILLNLWASWCPPCREEMPDIQDLHTTYKDDNFMVIGVNLTTSEKSIQNVKDFVEDYELTFPIFMDVNNEVGEAYQAISIPTSVFIDSEGIVQKRVIGSMSRGIIEENIKKLE